MSGSEGSERRQRRSLTRHNLRRAVLGEKVGTLVS